VERFQQQPAPKPEKGTSNIDPVQNILGSTSPLHVSDIIQLAEKNHQAKLSRDSIVSAILKKINAPQTFIRKAPCTFALKTEASE